MNTPGQGQGIMSGFTSNKYVTGAKDFLESNGLVAKFAFLILAIMVFIAALRAGGALLAWIFSPSPSPISDSLLRAIADPQEIISKIRKTSRFATTSKDQGDLGVIYF